jgi:hypothetical protein
MTMTEGLRIKLEHAEESLRRAEREVTVLQVRYETAESLRKASEERTSIQSEELGELRHQVLTLESENKMLKSVPTSKDMPN